MLFDNNLVFANNQAITATAPSSTVIDLQGGSNFSFGNASVFGEDLGVGDGVAVPKVAALINTTFTAGGAATLQIQFQGAPDNGSGAPGTYSTYVESDALPVANLVAGAKVFAVDWPLRALAAAMPRFIRLNFVVATGPFTAGKLFAGIVLQRDDWTAGNYPANYVAV